MKTKVASFLPLLLLMVLAAVTGCTSTRVTLPDGTRIDRVSVFTNPTIGPLTASKKADGTANFRMEGYGHAQTDVLKLILALADSGALVK